MDPILILVVALLGLPRLSYGESVMNHGAVGDGIKDDTSAFQKAWDNACNGSSGVYAPAGKVFLLNSLSFTGPCNHKPLNFTIDGEMRAESDPKKWQEGNNGMIPWLMFDNVERLVISGRGLLDGQGKGWWDIHCGRDHPGPNCIKHGPTMMVFRKCRNVSLERLRFRNSAQVHVTVFGSQNVNISDIKITSPKASPNTDGVHITSSSAVSITHSNLSTGDDCVSIGDHVRNVNVTFVNCGPGHGVSIGSLGGREVAVEDIRVSHVNFTRTSNGARIKTWPGGTGYVRRVEFSDIHFSSVQNPIIIDQFYGCAHYNNCNHIEKAVHIEGVKYMKMSGTSSTKVAVKLKCSEKNACSNVFMRDIELSPAKGIGSVSSLCTFVQGSTQGIVRPSSCL